MITLVERSQYMAQEDVTFLTVSQAASLLGVHPNTIRRWAQHNILKGYRLGTRGDWRFTKEALLQALQHEEAMSEAVEPSAYSFSLSSQRSQPVSVSPPAATLLSPQRSQPASLSPSPADFLAGGGEMGERIRNFDWSATTLGPVE